MAGAPCCGCAAIFAFVFAACALTSRNQTSAKKPLQDFDVSGAVLILISFSLLLCIPSFGQSFGWTSASFLIVPGAAAVSLAGLVLAEQKAAHPILPGRFIKRSVFILSVLALFLLMASLGILGFGLGGNGTIFMEVVLSGLTPPEACAGTGTYGLFRDLSAPFGVAVFVPLFTNQITSRIAAGTAEPAAAVASIHFLAAAEIVCVALGIMAVLLLPKRKVIKENEHAVKG